MSDLATRITEFAAAIEAHLADDESTAKPLEHSWVTAADPLTAAFSHRFDAKRMLRQVKASRGLVAAILAEPHVSVDDYYYSCISETGEPCDCGRDQRAARLLAIIASQWETT